ncbi:DUF3298 and DUF4163 domain-containing protein [Pseudoxanthomonas sp. z9]|uniref:DUF3298 and DUF4163 domain-containing protein n=1 Tax=Pseudoxanthomonas sp. z9 TaxID=2584942 RepID=UPI001143C9EF|nr:DUF3298 and DUF4163 domain-containing protein [Pseudoxanthomonas sp. z9]
MKQVHRISLLAATLVLALAACKREPDAAQPPTAAAPEAGAPATSPVAPEAPVELKDVIETNERYVVGITYPPGIDRYPGLAKALSDYAHAARGELMEAVDGFGNDKPTAPYELSLSFEKLLETPQVVAVAADGSRYTGGAHGQPLIARFVWLPQQNHLLSANDLIANAAGWQAVSDYVREQLLTGVTLRADADELEPAERSEVLKNASRMIDDGTEPKAENFAQFVPVLDTTGHISALRFVFPPYQVGPYADGTQTVDVPASVLRPHLAPAYSGLFAQ